MTGLERTFALNHMSYFLLTNLLLGALQKGQAPRVVNVSSQAHRMAKPDLTDLQMDKRWSSFGSYGMSKLLNLWFTFEFARRHAGIACNALHPGAVASNFGRSSPGWMGRLFALGAPFLLTPEKGARTSIWLASAPEVGSATGQYFIKQKAVKPSKQALDVEKQKRAWDESVRLFGLT